MVRHKNPRAEIHSAFLCEGSQAINEIVAVRIVNEYIFSFDTHAYDMMQNPGGI